MDHGKPTLEAAPPPATQGVEGPADAPPGDDRLIAETLAGDASAFGRLVERYQDRLVNALVRFTGSSEDARDIAQEAFVQAYQKLDRFRRDAAFFTWLYRIAFNRAVSHGRKRRERVSLDGLAEAGPVEPTATKAEPGPEARLDACERAALVHRALATLADDHREVLVLREFEELDYQQISAIVGVPVGTVRSRLFRARVQMRETLVGYGLES